jgi:hypothetical protein
MRRALVVGIDGYKFAPLAGCANDANVMTNLFAKHYDGSPNFDVLLITGPSIQVTCRTIAKKSPVSRHSLGQTRTSAASLIIGRRHA